MTRLRLILMCVLLLTFVVGLSAATTTEEKMDDFTLKTVTGDTVSLYETLNSGNVVIVDFWATWCKPCCAELPHLNELHEKYDNVTVIAISVDSKVTQKKVIKYHESNNFSLTTVLDPRSKVKKALGISAIPVTYIVAPDGTIAYKHTGYKPGDEVELEKKLIEILTAEKLLNK